MAKTTTTLTGVTTKNGSSAKGPWVLSIFSAADGGDFTTFDGGLASKASSLIGKSVEVTFEESQNGQFTRRTMQSVELVGAGEVAVMDTPVNKDNGTAYGPLRPQNDQFRTKEQIMRTDATNQALAYFALAGIDPIENPDEFAAWVDTFYKNIEQGTFETPDVRAEAAA